MIYRYSKQLLTILISASLLTACGTTNESAITTVPPVDPGVATPAAVVADSLSRVAQISVTDGTVSLRPNDDEEWGQADVNQPVFEGSELFADEGSTGEVVLGDNRYVRFADGADLEFTQLDSENVQLDVTAGTVTLALDELEASEHYELNTPGGAIVPSAGGEFRIDIDDNGDTWLTVRRGTAQVSTPNGTFELKEGDRVNLTVDNSSAIEIAQYDRTSPPDDWDTWNDERRVYYTGLTTVEHPAPVRDLYGRTDIFGIAALAAFGIWRAIDNDRYVWQPRVDRNWQPYQNGYWDYEPRAGYTWVSQDTWGWAPYHYGRWDHDDSNGWYWSPSDGITTVGYSTWSTRQQWRPALVYAFQPEQSNSVMWVPLSYGEPYVAYSRAWRDDSGPQQISFVPRHLRERRGIVYVSTDGFNRRQKARRADRREIAYVERFDVAKASPYVMTKPGRIVSADHIAKVRPSNEVRGRAVVVRADVDKGDKGGQRRAAKADRPVRKADAKKFDAPRATNDAARVKPAPRVTKQGGKMRSGRKADGRAGKAGPFDNAAPAGKAGGKEPKAGGKGKSKRNG